MYNNRIAPGTVVKFKVTGYNGPSDIVFPNMYGFAVDDSDRLNMFGEFGFPFYLNMTEYIHVYGRNKPCYYSASWFDVLNEMSNEEDLAASIHITEHSFELFEEKYGYTGYIKMGKSIHPQNKYLEELSQFPEKMMGWKGDIKYSTHIDGNMKRIKRILRAFKHHPLSSQAYSLSEKIKNTDSSSPDIEDRMQELENWVKQAEKTEIKEIPEGIVNLKE